VCHKPTSDRTVWSAPQGVWSPGLGLFERKLWARRAAVRALVTHRRSVLMPRGSIPFAKVVMPRGVVRHDAADPTWLKLVSNAGGPDGVEGGA
jgi:hypothetical protein